MLLKNISSQGIFLYEYTIATGAPKTGDSASITGYWSLDGGSATVFGTTNPTELSAAHMPGVYWQPLAQGETNGNAIAYCWTSSTSGVAIDPILVLTTGVSIPAVAFAGANGLITSGTGTGQLTTTSGAVLLQATQSGVTIPTVTTVTNQLTAAQIATGIWQDATAGDFTTASSIGKSLYTSGNIPGAANGLFISGTNSTTTVNITGNVTGNLTGSVGSVTGSVGSVTGSVGSVTGNVGGNVVGSVANVTGSVASVTGSVGSVTGSVGSVTGNVGGNVVGSVASVTAAVTISTSQVLTTARALDSIADTSLTVNDAFHCAIAGATGKETVVGTTYTVKTPSTGTTLRTFTLDSGTAPTQRT